MWQYWSTEFLTREGFVSRRPIASAVAFLDFDPVAPDDQDAARSTHQSEDGPGESAGDRSQRPGL